MVDEQPKIEKPAEQKAEIVPVESKTGLTAEITETDAFKLYLEMGIERSLAKLNQSVSNSYPALTLNKLKQWSKTYGWVEKADQYDRDAHEQAMKVALKQAMVTKIDMLTICRTTLLNYAKDLKGNEVIIRKTDKKGNVTEEIKVNKYHPSTHDAVEVYRVIKEELGEGLPDFQAVKEINLTQVIQYIIKNHITKDAYSNSQPEQ